MTPFRWWWRRCLLGLCCCCAWVGCTTSRGWRSISSRRLLFGGSNVMPQKSQGPNRAGIPDPDGAAPLKVSLSTTTVLLRPIHYYCSGSSSSSTRPHLQCKPRRLLRLGMTTATIRRQGRGFALHGPRAAFVGSSRSKSSTRRSKSEHDSGRRYRNHPYGVAAMAVADTFTADYRDDDTVNESAAKSMSLTSPITPVYIEDTDAYGVMYNANYVRAYDRALQELHFEAKRRHDDYGGEYRATILQAIDAMKFKAAPTLGSSYIIVGRRRVTSTTPLHGISDDNDNTGTTTAGQWTEVWDLEMHQSDSVDTSATTTTTTATAATPLIYNVATGVHVVVMQQRQMYGKSINDQGVSVSGAASAAASSSPATISSTKTDTTDTNTTPRYQTTHTFSLYRDELDVFHTYTDAESTTIARTTKSECYVPLFRVLNFMERARSSILGGPDALQRLQVEHGILIVVTGLYDLRLSLEPFVSLPSDNGHDHNGVAIPLVPGTNCIQVDTSTVWKRQGTVLECYQTVLYRPPPSSDDDVSTNTGRTTATLVPMASGMISLLAIDAVTKRPVRSLPSWVQEQLLQVAALV